MRVYTVILAVVLIATGCDSRDAKLHRQISGTWPIRPSGSMTFFADGRFHFTNSFVYSNTTLAWASDGTWDVRHGFLITTITNSIAEGTDEKPPVGRTSRYKINFVDEHDLAYGDELHGSSYHR
jgi:hypothetical protein